MDKHAPTQPSPKLQALLRDFQQIANGSGFVNHSFDLPQLRLMFTLYGRLHRWTAEEAELFVPLLLVWAEGVSQRLREQSASAVLPPQIHLNPILPAPEAGYLINVTLTFSTKVTETSYFRTKAAVESAYRAATQLRTEGLHLELVSAS